jgi:hypothetical protein
MKHMKTRNKPSSRERVQKHRAKLKRQGLRPLQIWVPDTENPRFRAECRRQSRLIAADPHEKEIMDWIERAQDTSGWVWEE